MKIFKLISDKFKKNQDSHFHIEGLPISETHITDSDNGDSKENEIYMTGGCCIAAGINSKIIPSGFCTHPEKRTVNPMYLDGLPISECHWTHCVFYRKDSDDDTYKCFFGGECQYCVKSNNKE